MSVNSRFAISIHVLTLLALHETEFLTSVDISESVNTNPVFIRRILGLLRNAGLVTTQLGTEGGSCLAQPPAEITLLAIYQATMPDPLFTLPHRRPNPFCLCGSRMESILQREFDQAETALEAALNQTTLAHLADEIKIGSREFYSA